MSSTNLLVLVIGTKFRSFCDRLAAIGMPSLLLWGAAAHSAFAQNPGVMVTNLHSFADYPDGNYPYGLVQGGDAYFYGTTWGGGVYNNGTIFKISASGAYASLYSFAAGTDGGRAGLVAGSDGNFYGTTPLGGTNDSGTVFRISPSGIFTGLYSFTGGTDGGLPEAELVKGSDGYFYGTTAEGGTNDSGTVFRISPSGIFTGLYSFTGGTDGSGPLAGLVEGSDGYFYGTASAGGANDNGTVFKISASGSFTKLYAFSGGAGGSDPEAGLVEGSDGYFYGTTSAGGTNDNGTVFRISAGGAFTQFYAFPGGGADGFRPVGRLAKGSDGYLYGATFHSGSYFGTGTLFRISANGAFTSLYLFNGGTDGKNPVAGLVEGGDGYFYGTTRFGGEGGSGVVFRLSILPPAPVFQTFSLTQSAINMSWSTEVGESYQVQYVTELNSTNWTTLGSPLTAAGPTLSATDYVTNASARLYRVVRFAGGQ